MKKLLGILVLGLLISQNVFANEEVYLRCIPEVTVVRAGDMKKGAILQHRIMYFKFENEIDLTVSEKPRRILKKHKLYMSTSKGKKDKLSFSNLEYIPTLDKMSIDFEDSIQSKTQQYLSTMNVNYDGSSWVASGNYSFTSAKGTDLIKDNMSWFAKCYEITKKKFKKPEPNKEFFDKYN
jgi:hypothetical protein